MKITLSSSDLDDLVARRIEECLTPEKLEEIGERHIAHRIGMLTLEQAARHLQCANTRQLADFCREHKIPIEHFGAKKRFILISEIEAAQQRKKMTLPRI